MKVSTTTSRIADRFDVFTALKIIADAGFDNDFYRVLVKDKRLVDLRPYMEKSDFWMDVMRKDILAQCVEEDGSIYLSPLSS